MCNVFIYRYLELNKHILSNDERNVLTLLLCTEGEGEVKLERNRRSFTNIDSYIEGSTNGIHFTQVISGYYRYSTQWAQQHYILQIVHGV